MKRVLSIMLAVIMVIGTPMTALASIEGTDDIEIMGTSAETPDVTGVPDVEEPEATPEVTPEVGNDQEHSVDPAPATPEVTPEANPTEEPAVEDGQDHSVDSAPEAVPTEEPELTPEVTRKLDLSRASKAANEYDVVVDGGANPKDTKGDSAAIQKLLNLNKQVNVNDTSKTITIYFPAGTYYLDEGLNIFSNTKLILDKNAILIRQTLDGKMITGHGKGSLRTAGGYNQMKNITIDGGIWDGNDINGKAYDGLMMFRHSSNVTIKNATLKNCTEHFLNISASQGAVIDGCTFKDAKEYAGSDKDFWGSGGKDKTRRYKSIEAIHMDSATKATEKTATPIDNTPCQNITVKNCTFDKVFAGVGNHHLNPEGKKTANIRIENNTFTNILYTAVWADGFSNVKVLNNTAKAVGMFFRSDSSTGEVSGNKVSGNVNNFIKSGFNPEIISRIQLYNGSSFTIKNNNLKGGNLNGIAVFTGAGKNKPSSAKIEGNTIGPMVKHGIHVLEAKNVTVRNNTAGGNKVVGIYVDKSTNVTVDKNNFSNNKNRGIVIANSSKVTFSNNVISNNKERGMVILESKNVTIKGNEVLNNSSVYDIAAYNRSTGKIQSNIVGNAKRIFVSGDSKFTVSKNRQKQFVVKYNGSGATSGKMSNTKVTYGKNTGLRANAFKRTGHKFSGWNAYRASDKKWFYSKGRKSGWYKKDKQPSGYKLHLYKNKAKVSKETEKDKDTLTMYAVWKK